MPGPKDGVILIPDAGGLGIAETPRRIDFGRAPEGVIAVLTRELGAPQDMGLAGCPAPVTRHLRWGALTLSFTGERFVGWRSDRGTSAGTVCAL